MRDFWRAIRFAAISKKLMSFAMITVALATAMNIFIPIVFQQLFDLVGNTLKIGHHANVPVNFWFLIAAYALLVIFNDVFGRINDYATTLWYNKTREELSKKAYAKLESLSLNYFESNSTGKIKERIDKGIWELNDIIEESLAEILPQFIYVVIAASILFSVNKVFGILLLVCVPLFVIITLKFSPTLMGIQDEARDSNERLSGLMTESIINIKTIKSYATEERHFKLFSKQLVDSINKDIAYQMKRIIMNIFRVIVMDFAQITIIGLGLYWVLTNKISLGVFMLAWQYTNRSLQPLWFVTRMIDDIQKKMRSVRRVFGLLDTEPEVKDNASAKTLKIKKGDIRFEKVSFNYKEQNQDVIRNLSLDIPAGNVLAIVGKSGSGKTTLVKLLTRFYDIQKGNISIDDVNICNVTQKSLRENIGVVLQDSILFNDTVANNIAYGKPSATKKEIERAAKMANAEGFIENLPNGYDTIVGERGVKLSGGEQQRINIARAILKNPPVLVLDEATSSLDSESEQLIQEALWRLITGKTTIIIAHRLSTVMKADMIVVMDKGKITESGTHDDLVSQKGIYAKLFEIQSGGYLG